VSTESFPIRAESLLQHREFVRALARSLVRDEHAALDVVQETWLEALRHPPRSTAALPGWLARVVRTRAQNVARGESRRVAREQVAAREELDESEEKLREQVAMQHKVVEAVLALKEPYKTVVLLRYYEGLSPSQIAARRDVPPGSVRAQLSRAHELLRERLDAEFGGSRAAWAVGLSALARGRGGLAFGAKLAALGAVAAAAAVPVILWVGSPRHDPSLDLAALEPIAATPPATPIEPLAPVSVPAPSSSARSAMPLAPAPEQIHTKEELESMSVRQLLQVAIHVQQTLRAKLLTPAEDLKRTYASLLALPDTGLARILNRDQFGSFESNALGLRGAGSCFSFATGKPSWDEEPDVEIADGWFRCLGYGPGILDLGERRLEDLPTTSAPIPDRLGEKERTAWEVYWSDCGLSDRGVSPEFSKISRSIGLPAPKVRIGHAYLVRGITPGAHDVLAAFVPVANDERGWTIAWRVLHTWPVTRTRVAVDDPYWILPDAPAVLAGQSAEALLELFAGIRSAARAKLFDVPAGLKERYASLLEREDCGIARLLTLGRYGPFLDGRFAGAAYSFATRESESEREPDLELERGMYRTAYHGGGPGLLLDLGAIPIDAVGGSAASEPAGLSDDDREAWRFLWTAAPATDRRGLALSPADGETSRRLQLDRGVAPAIGHTYLMRSILPGEHDVLAVFTTAARDEHGDWIAYRVIWNRKLKKDTEPR
jgi:RNA polymerase sigma-70 factor (ECF subfamily)